MNDKSNERNCMGETLAGVVGFEPTISCTKNSCPTTRPHPNRDALITLDPERVQEQNSKKSLVFEVFAQLDKAGKSVSR